MKKYIDPENDRYQFMVRETLNGYSIEVLVISSNTLAALTPQVAADLQVALPRPYRMQSCAKETAIEQLDELAALNGWVPIE